MRTSIVRGLVFILSLAAMTTYGAVLKEELFATPYILSAKISPDGHHIAYIGADESGIANVFIRALDETSIPHTQISFFTTPDIIQFFWSGDSQKILLLKDEQGTGRLHLHGLDIHTKEAMVYTAPFPESTAKVIQISAKENRAVIGLNHRNPHFHDLYLLDLDSGKVTLLFENDRYAKFLVSDSLDLILKMHIHEEDGSWSIWTATNTLFMKLSAADAFQTEFLSYHAANQSIYLLDNRFSDTNQLVAKSLSIPNQELLLGGQSYSDVDEVLFLNGEPKAYASYEIEKQWHILDPSIENEISFLESTFGSNFEIVNSSREGDLWVVSQDVPDQGIQFWVYDTKSQKLSSLGMPAPNQTFAKMYALTLSARDGKKLIGYYTLPQEVDKGGYVEKPIPLVVVPHGGPFKVRDKFQFNRYHQWLASCGYAVLSVNFRLSSGFGKAFVTAGNGEWGGKAHEDVLDAVEACIAKGITERGRLAILGGSYGGYESLAALTFTPEYFTCCIAICAPSNLKTVLDHVPQFWEFTSKPLSDKTMFFTKQAFITSMGGHPDDPQGIQHLQKCSPLNYLDCIQAPLLLVHGKNDHVVSEKESEQIYHSMKAHHKNVTYLLFPDEGHRFAYFANHMMCLDQAEYFLSHYLGGSYTPVRASVLSGSSGQLFK